MLQRVSSASVSVNGEVVGCIDAGILALVAVAPTDGPEQIAWMAAKIVQIRIFPDQGERMAASVIDRALGVLLVSQFTLYGDVRKGRRPGFLGAAPPEIAAPRFDALVAAVRGAGVGRVATGTFGADMAVSLTNDGPFTLVLDSP